MEPECFLGAGPVPGVRDPAIDRSEASVEGLGGGRSTLDAERRARKGKGGRSVLGLGGCGGDRLPLSVCSAP